MKSITIVQPFAELIASGAKRVENRTWPTTYRGPLVIHAGSRKKYGGHPVERIAESYGITRPLDLGKVVAVCDLVACVHFKHGQFTPKDALERYPQMLMDTSRTLINVHVEGPWCFLLANIRRLDEPIAWPGCMGLWDVPADLERKINPVLSVAGVEEEED